VPLLSPKRHLLRRANQWPCFARPAQSQRGVCAIATNVGCKMRWTLTYREASGKPADGEIVWSRPPDAEVKPCGRSARRRWLKSPVHRGEHEIHRKTIAQGMPDRFGVPVVTCLRAFLCCMQGCGCVRASGIPCALCSLGGTTMVHHSGISCRGNPDSRLTGRHRERSDLSAEAWRRRKQSRLSPRRQSGFLRRSAPRNDDAAV
jgi:hypothetical protein